jgi:hypothetical protein
VLNPNAGVTHFYGIEKISRVRYLEPVILNEEGRSDFRTSIIRGNSSSGQIFCTLLQDNPIFPNEKKKKCFYS